MKKLIPFILIFALFSAACGEKPVEETPAPPSVQVTETPTPTPTPSPSPTPEPFRALLTGEPVETEPSNGRPYAVIINNISVAMPHCGVSQADIIYEVLAEGEITRMMPIFSDITDVGVLGSMRSARPYYIEIARSYDAVLVHAGGSEQAYYDISAKRVNNIDGVRGAYGDVIFYRDPNRMEHGYEHSLFTTSELILEYMPILGYREEHETDSFDYGLSFADDVEMENARSGKNVVVSFSGLKTTSFKLNAEGYYTAEQYGVEYIDGNNDELVLFRNLLVLYADTRIIDNEGRRAVTLNGTGNGLFFCDGKVVDITWRRSGDGEKFTYYLADGSPLTLGTGKSYIAFVPTGSEIVAE